MHLVIRVLWRFDGIRVGVWPVWSTWWHVERAQLETVRVLVASARNGAHFLARMVDGVAILVFYAALYRLVLIPRALAGFGLIAAVLQIISVAMPLFGHDVVFPMLAPLGLSQLIVALWLMVKGFRPQPRTGIAPSDV
jgi:hypothetical protein